MSSATWTSFTRYTGLERKPTGSTYCTSSPKHSFWILFVILSNWTSSFRPSEHTRKCKVNTLIYTWSDSWSLSRSRKATYLAWPHACQPWLTLLQSQRRRRTGFDWFPHLRPNNFFSYRSRVNVAIDETGDKDLARNLFVVLFEFPGTQPRPSAPGAFTAGARPGACRYHAQIGSFLICQVLAFGAAVQAAELLSTGRSTECTRTVCADSLSKEKKKKKKTVTASLFPVFLCSLAFNNRSSYPWPLDWGPDYPEPPNH